MSNFSAKTQKGIEAREVSNAGAAATGYRRLEARTDGWYDIDDAGVAVRLQSGTGWVNYTGTPLDNQIAVFTDADTIEGNSGLTYNSSTTRLDVTGKGYFSNGISINVASPSYLFQMEQTLGTSGGIGGYVYTLTSGSSDLGAGERYTGFKSNLGAGYTGTSGTSALSFYNLCGGSGNNPYSGTGRANYGVAGDARGATSVGTNVGGFFSAIFGFKNYGLMGSATNNSYGAELNVGVIGFAREAEINVGGYFGLFTNAEPTFVSAALIADNGSTSSPIFLARDGGIVKVSIADGGLFGLSNYATVSVDTIETTLTNSDTKLPTSGAVYDAIQQSALGWVNTAGVPANDQVAVWTDANTIEGTNDLTFNVTNGLVSTNGSGYGLTTRRNSSSTGIGTALLFKLYNDASSYVDYALIIGRIGTNTAGAHTGYLSFSLPNAGTVADVWVISTTAFYPYVDNTYDIGTSSYQVKNLYLKGTAYLDNLTLTTGATVTEIETALTNSATKVPTSSAVYGAISQATQGWVNTTGTPADNQVAVWTDANTLEGTNSFVFDGYLRIGTTGNNGKLILNRTSDGGSSTTLEVTGTNGIDFKLLRSGGVTSELYIDNTGFIFKTEETDSPYARIERFHIGMGDTAKVYIVNSSFGLSNYASVFVDTIETTLTDDDTHIPTSGAVYGAITGLVETGTAQGQMLFWNATASKWVHTETSELFWDDTNKRLGVGASSPTARFSVSDGTTEYFTVLDNYWRFNLGYIPSTATSYNETINIGGNINFETVRPPLAAEINAITLTENLSGGTLGAGVYNYNIVYVDYEGRMCGAVDANKNITISANSSVTLTNIPCSPDRRVLKRWVMRSYAGGGQYLVYKLYEINDNTTTTYTDTGALTLNENYRVYRAPNKSAGQLKLNGYEYLYSDDYNTFFGRGAGQANTRGQSLVGIGYQALIVNTTGEENVAIGLQAGGSNTTGNGNIYMNYAAGMYNLGSYNLGLGTSSIRLASSPGNYSTNYCIGVGHQSLFNIPNSSAASLGFGYQTMYQAGYAGGAFNYNLGMGYQALYKAGYTTGSTVGNIALGYRAGYQLGYTTQVVHNILIGYAAGASGASGWNTNNDGSYGIGIGYQALYNNNGDQNIGLGYNSLYGTSTSTASHNIAIGGHTGEMITSGSYNVYIGYNTGKNNTSGTTNVFLGYQAGYNNITGGGNVFLGYMAGEDETGSNKLYVHNSDLATPLIYGEFDNKLFRINGSFQVRADSTNIAAIVDTNGFGLSNSASVRVDTIETTITDDDTHFPTSGAVMDYVKGRGVVVPHTFTYPLTVSGSVNLPGFFVPVPSGITVKLLGCRYAIDSGTSITFKVTRRASGGSWANITGFGTTASPLSASTTATTTDPTDVTLSAYDELRLETLTATGTPTNLRVTLFLYYGIG